MRLTRHLLAIAAQAGLCALALAGPATPAANRQLLKNPGFEAGTQTQAGLNAVVPEHWNRDWQNKGKVELIEDAALAHSGKKALRVADASAFQGRFSAEPGMKYRVRAWLKGEGKASARLVFYLYKSTGEKKTPYRNVGAWSFDGPPDRLSDGWVMYEKTYIAPGDGSVDSISVAVHAGGAALVDDVTLRAWDGRPLNVRAASSPLFMERERINGVLAAHPEIEKKRGAAWKALAAKADALAEAKADTLEQQEKGEADLEALLDSYAQLRREIDLDLED